MSEPTPSELTYLRSLPRLDRLQFIADLEPHRPDLVPLLRRELLDIDFLTDDKQAVADFFGRSRRTIEDWLAAGCPYQSNGRGQRSHYDLRAITRWLVQRRQLDTAPLGDDNDDVELRYREEKTKIAELHRRKLESELVDRAAYLACMNDLVDKIETGLRPILQRHGGDTGLDDLNDLFTQIRHILKGMENDNSPS